MTGNVDSVKRRAKVKGPHAFDFLIEKSIRSRVHWCKRFPRLMTTMKNIWDLRNKLRSVFCVNLLNNAFWKGQRPNEPTKFWWELTERGKCRHSVLSRDKDATLHTCFISHFIAARRSQEASWNHRNARHHSRHRRARTIEVGSLRHGVICKQFWPGSSDLRGRPRHGIIHIWPARLD
jgi:hypothetical protein